MVCKEIQIVAVWFVAWSRQFWRFSCVCEEKELVVSPDGGWLSSFHWLFAQFFSSVCDPLTASCRIWMDQSKGEPLKLVRMPRRCPDGQDRLRIYLIRMPFKIYLLFSVEMGYYICLLGGGKEWVSVCVCVCACDAFPDWSDQTAGS